MSDTEPQVGTGSLVNANVRDRIRGLLGHVARVDYPWIYLAWGEAAQMMRPERILVTDPVLDYDIEVYTDSQGWQPLARFVAPAALRRQREVDRTARINGRFWHADPYLRQEASSPFNPFSHSDKRGPGPKGREDKKKGRYTCRKTGDRTQACLDRETGKTRTVKVSKDYRKSYDPKWRAHAQEKK
jgi:hypothetical protein